ncbi:MAG TPA: hypothetical protein VHN99_08725 [Deinococcales bacterium]|nr:hypothetical protein [Deinococcales bacterium]
MSPFAFLHGAGLALYAANLALGVGVQTRTVSTRRVRWVHHVLYAVVFAAALLVTALGFLSGARPWPLLGTLAALAVMPRLRGGTRWHGLIAALGGLGYLL